MKTQRIVLPLIIGMLLGGVVGYKIAMQNVILSGADYIRLMHESTEHTARAYYFTMASLKASGVAPPSDLKSRALAWLTIYAEEATMLTTLEGQYGQIPINTNFHQEVLAFLNTTNTETNSTHQPTP